MKEQNRGGSRLTFRALSVAVLCLAGLLCFGAHRHHIHRHRPKRHHHKSNILLRSKEHHFNDAGHPIRYAEFKLGRARYSAVLANVGDPSVEASAVLSNQVSNVRNLVRSPGTCAAITGTFFAPRSGYPVGDVVIDGALKVSGRRGSAIAIDYSGQPHVFDTDYGRAVDWSTYRWGLRGVVRILRKGVVGANPKAQRFHDSRIWSRVARTGAGITRCGKLVFLATTSPVTLSEFARAMLHLGVQDAVSLDGGSSTCLYYRGVVVIRPARRLSNMLVLSERVGAGGTVSSRASGGETYLNQ